MQVLWQAHYMVCPERQLIVLQGMKLNTGTAEELIHASKAMGWSSLYPFLTRLADATYAWACTESASGAGLSLKAFQGLKLLLGKLVSILQRSRLSRQRQNIQICINVSSCVPLCSSCCCNCACAVTCQCMLLQPCSTSQAGNVADWH
jgi:hypothetical protein